MKPSDPAARVSDHQRFRDPAQACSIWEGAPPADPSLFEARVRGPWWDLLASLGITLLITREYEHLLIALRGDKKGGRVSYLTLPHPSGLAVDQRNLRVYVAATRNPNQIIELAPVRKLHPRSDAPDVQATGCLVPRSSVFLPGCTYVHDLAMIGGALHANAVGMNAVMRVEPDAAPSLVWWPRCIQTPDGPRTDRNYIQLNSIAAAPTIEQCFFSASADRISRRRPGHLNFPVDGRGVIFSGRTREPVIRGLTRPHSARLNREKIWVDNSGYGQVGFGDDGRFVPAASLQGWTRGLCFVGDVAFVGTSRIIPRFRCYAPGLDPAQCICGIHALNIKTGRIIASLLWPNGNQIFAIDYLPSDKVLGLPFDVGGRSSSSKTRVLFYRYSLEKKHARHV